MATECGGPCTISRISYNPVARALVAPFGQHKGMRQGGVLYEGAHYFLVQKCTMQVAVSFFTRALPSITAVRERAELPYYRIFFFVERRSGIELSSRAPNKNAR